MVAGRGIRWILRQWTERTPDKPFLIWEPFDRDGRTWTYGELSRDADGWFDTGDVICMDEVGNLFFSDWDKDMLRVGSENVAASEIETVIMETGWVTECAVIGQKHFMLDDMPRTILDKISKVDLRGRLTAIEA